LIGSGLAGAGTFTLYGTGFSSTGQLLSTGSTDGNWTLISDPSGSVNTPDAPYVTEGCQILDLHFPCGLTNDWTPDTLGSQWISPQKSYDKNSDPAGTYIYEDTFNLTGFNDSLVDIIGQWSADNYGYIVVNGQEVTSGVSGQIANQTGQFEHFTSFNLNSSNTDFISGINTIEFVVVNTSNGDPDVTGVNIDIESKTAFAPEPGSFALMGLGLSGLYLGVKRRKRR
jgi:PEP-CTERM motif